ncbi:unnamed protein product [Timema podura]|uniref:Zinc finger PHD-type domain-containing protein n=1 Tax=Timema podura TaxID=61482 RepID=A0ABN7NVN9_TIMPD|nr:unnamed protein product [Timema podura]
MKHSSEGICYCGKGRNLNIAELLCASCSTWFHESCIGYQLGKLVPLMMNYFFVCKNCSATGLETFKKNQATFPQMCVTAIGNLMQASIKEGKPRKMFSKDHDIVPFIDCHWEGMTTMARRVTQSWHATLLGTRDSDYSHFTTVLEEEAPITGNNDIPALPNLTYIRRKTDDGKQKNDNALLGTRDSDYSHFTTVLEEEAPITGNNDIPALPNLTYIRRKTDDGKQKNDNAVSQ